MKKLVLLLLLIPFIGFNQAPNDLCDNPITITDFGCFDGTNVDAMDDIESCPGCHVPNCGRHDEVWFDFVATSTDISYSLSSSELSYIEILLYDTCDGSLLHDNCGATTLNGVLADLTIGETYYLAISSDDNNQGVFNICLGTSLPIELTEFDGYDEDKVNHVHWITASELNNDYFTLEKSEDGMTWDELTRIEGAGNSSIDLYYKYTDEHPHIFYTYYRLKQTDFDGKYEYSDIIAIENSSTVFYTYTTSPDDGFIYLSSSYYFELFNTMGQRVDFGEADKINTNILTQGVYILRVGNYTQKFYVQ